MNWNGLELPDKPYYQDDAVIIYNADCRDILPLIPDKSIDLVLTDPPYGIGADKANAHSSIRDNPKWQDDWDYLQPEAIELAIRLGKSAAVWGGNYYPDVLPASAAWLAWLKPEASTGFSLADFELCWTNGLFAARCKTFNRRDGNAHPTQKPVEVMTWTLSFFQASLLILDPFLGSGTTALASKILGRKCIGIEIEEKYCEIAAKRCSQMVMNLRV